jgi:hypothetical protein
MASSRSSQDRPLNEKKEKKKKKRSKELIRKVNREEQRRVNKFKDYNFTPLNAEISEVLMEIKRDSEFRQPPKIPGNHPQKNEGKYYDFHERTGHHTEGA